MANTLALAVSIGQTKLLLAWGADYFAVAVTLGWSQRTGAQRFSLTSLINVSLVEARQQAILEALGETRETLIEMDREMDRKL